MVNLLIPINSFSLQVDKHFVGHYRLAKVVWTAEKLCVGGLESRCEGVHKFNELLLLESEDLPLQLLEAGFSLERILFFLLSRKVPGENLNAAIPDFRDCFLDNLLLIAKIRVFPLKIGQLEV